MAALHIYNMSAETNKQTSLHGKTSWTMRHILVTIALFSIGFIEVGVMKSFGVLVNDLVIQLQSDTSTIGLVMGAWNCTIYVISPLVSPLLKYLSLWNLAAIGLASAGWLCLSSFASSLAMFTTCMLAAGACFSFLALAAVTKFYEIVPANGSDLAFGFAMSGNAVGMIFLPIATEIMREIYGWRGAILILAGVTAHLSVCIVQMKEPPVSSTSNDDAESREREEDAKPLLESCPSGTVPHRKLEDKFIDSDADVTKSNDLAVTLRREISAKDIGSLEARSNSSDHEDTITTESMNATISMDASDTSDNEASVGCSKDGSSSHASQFHVKQESEFHENLSSTLMLKCRQLFGLLSTVLGIQLVVDRPAIILLYLYDVINGMMNTVWVIFLIPHGVSKGFLMSQAVYLASFGGIGNLIGRIAQGPLIHKRWLTSLDLTIILGFINAAVFMVDPLVDRFSILAVNAFIGGLTIGARITLFYVIRKQFFRSDQFATALGLSCFFSSIGKPFGGMLAGWLADVLDFGMAFMVMGAIELAGCMLLVPSRYFLKREDDTDDVKE